MTTDWRELEQQVSHQTLEAHDPDAALAEELMGHMLTAFRELQGTKTESPVDELVFLLATGGTNYLYLAFDLAFKGYYAQSLSLSRSAFEFWLAGAYVVAKPHKAASLKRHDAKWPSAKKMRATASIGLGQAGPGHDTIRTALDSKYGFLSQFAHPRFYSVSSVFESPDAVRLGPFYRKNGLLHSLSNAFTTALLFYTLLPQTFSELKGTDWSKKAMELIGRVGHWLREIDADERAT